MLASLAFVVIASNVGAQPQGQPPSAPSPPPGIGRGGPRGPGGPGGHGPGFPGFEAPMRKGTFLGVSAIPVPEPLQAQIELPDKFGLVIGHVVPDSPAAKAGLEIHDILYKIDEHVLVNPEQLGQLV